MSGYDLFRKFLFIKVTAYQILFLAVLINFFLILQRIFDNVNESHDRISTNESDHLSRGLNFCKSNFKDWDWNTENPSSASPGLYIITGLTVGWFKLCSVYWLRFINLIASVINLALFFVLISSHKRNKQGFFMNLLQSINLSLLPPLYFFNNLYYPDIISITSVLALLIFNKKKCHILASIMGIMAIIIDKHNIVWVGLTATNYISRSVLKKWKERQYNFKSLTFEDIIHGIREGELKIIDNIKKLKGKFWINVTSYLSVLIIYCCFLIKKHDLTEFNLVNLTQAFYFSIFCVIFTWSCMVQVIPIVLKKALNRKLHFIVLLIIFGLVVFYNTIELENVRNSKNVLYIWKALYSHYWCIRYAIIPIYFLAMSYIMHEMENNAKQLYAQIFMVFMCFSLIIRPVVDIKHFLLPYIIFRSNLRNSEKYQLQMEFLYYCSLNIVSFYIFLLKTTDVLELIW